MKQSEYEKLCDEAFGKPEKRNLLKVLNDKKPSFFVVLAGVAALIFVVLFLLTNLSAEDPLEQCRKALEFHQAQNACKITMVFEFSGDHVSEIPMEETYWRYGENYLVNWHIESGSHFPGWVLKAGGGTYCKGIGRYYPEGNTDYWSWVATDKIPDEAFTDWLDEYQWNADDITLIQTEKYGRNTIVTFQVNQESVDSYGGIADHQTVTFCLDGKGRLVYERREVTTSGIYEGEAYSGTSVGKGYVSYDEETILDMIIRRNSEVPAPHKES